MFKTIPLKILDLLRPLFVLLKIDYPVMRKIVEMKLLMDGRRVPVMFNNQAKKPKGNQFAKSMGIYMLYSLILIPFVFGDNYMFQLSILFGIALFILMTALISDFSVVLLDVRDKTILGTKPIHARTISAAKFVHIAIYMTLLTGAFTLIPGIVMLFAKGIVFFGIFVVTMVFVLLFIISLTSLIYIFVLRFFSAEQLKDMINYIQIAMSVGIIIGYQIVIRSFEFVELDAVYQFSWWNIFLPSFWFAAPFEMIMHANYSAIIILFVALAIAIPLISIGLYYLLMPTFERNLEKLMEEAGSAKKKRFKVSYLWEKLICVNKEERAFFRFANAMLSEEREFKLKVYPSLGMAIVFPFLFMFTLLDDVNLSTLRSGSSYLYIYFINIIIGIVIYMLQYSGKYKGAWIFQVVTMDNPRRMYSAALKAFLTRLYLPVFMLVAIVFVYIFTIDVWIDLVVVFLVAIMQTLLTYQILIRTKFPFTQPFESAQQGGGISMKIMFLMVFTGLFAVIHFLIGQIPFGIYGYAFLLIIVIFVWWKLLFAPERMIEEY